MNTKLELLTLDRLGSLGLFPWVAPRHFAIVYVNVDKVIVVSFKFFVVANVRDILLPLI